MAQYICGDDGTARRQLDEIEAMESVLGKCRKFQARLPFPCPERCRLRTPAWIPLAALRCPPTSLLSVTTFAGPAKVEVETGLRERLLAAAAAVPESDNASYFDSAPPGRLKLEVSAADGTVGVVGQLTLTLPPRCDLVHHPPNPKRCGGGGWDAVQWLISAFPIPPS